MVIESFWAFKCKRSGHWLITVAAVGCNCGVCILRQSGYLFCLFDASERLPQLLTLLGSDVSDVSILDSWKRPLLTIDQALPRFLTSPILGTGFSAGKIEPFVVGTNYFHNDLIWMLVVSGIVGAVLFLGIFMRFARKVTVLMLVPLFCQNG